FTKVWLSMKFCFFPLIASILAWFWNRVNKQAREPALLEYMLLFLGAALAFLDLPLEYLTLHFDMPYMLLLSDVRQGVFYGMLLSFWLVFAGEHMLIQDNGARGRLKCYWRHLSTIGVACASLLAFDLCERGAQLADPFFTIWATPVGANLALAFVVLAGLAAALYLAFLVRAVWRAFRSVGAKRSALPSMSRARRLHYEGVIYRFNFLMLATVVCATVTIISFVLTQVSEGQSKWDESVDLELSSVVH
nr:wntless [Cucujiformia]